MKSELAQVVRNAAVFGLLSLGLSACAPIEPSDEPNFAGKYEDAHGTYSVKKGNGRGPCPPSAPRQFGSYPNESPGMLRECLGYSDSE